MSQKTVQDILSKHRLAEDAIRNGLSEAVTQKQQLIALGQLFARLESAEIAEILDGLSPEDLLFVWGQIDEERLDTILDDVSDATRDTLASRSSYLGAACVVNAFELSQEFLGPVAPPPQAEVEHYAASRPAVLPEIGLMVLPSPTTT